MKNNNEDLTIPIEDVQHCEAILEHSRHAGSIPVARSPSENDASVESSVENQEGGDASCTSVHATTDGLKDAALISNSAPNARAAGAEIASESGHWYLPDGTPFYTTERRSGPQKGAMRPVSLRHDRKLLMSLCAVPSVTTVANILDKPGLVRYRARNVFDATVRLYDYRDNSHHKFEGIEIIGGSDELFEKVYAESEEHRKTAADRGTALHGAIERFLRGDSDVSSPWMPHIMDMINALAQYGITLRRGPSPDSGIAEHSFAYDCGTGCYGGKVDYHERSDDGLVIDFKSKDEITDAQLAGKDKLVYDEHAMQLAAYREGLRMPDARCINVFVGERDKRVFIYEHNESDLKRGFKLFQAVLNVWKIKNNYYVRIVAPLTPV